MSYLLKRGLNIPVVTAIDEAGRVLEDDQRRVIRHIIQDGYGADVIFGVGTTGEWNRLANHERQRAMEIQIGEVGRINAELRELGRKEPVEVWAGVNGKLRAEVLANLDAAIQLGADAAVIAPLAIEDLDEREISHFFQREITNLLEASKRDLPIFLYDNADISAPGQPQHLRTRLVKELSRLPWLRGIKVSASRRVLGNYTKAALHFKLPGEFGIYIGNAMLIFEIYRPSRGLIGRFREGWRDYLLYDTPPIGVVSGPANVMPREWQKAWRVCWAGDQEMSDLYLDLCARFERICGFEENGRRIRKTIACIKYALELDRVITCSLVGSGTKPLTDEQKKIFAENYSSLCAHSQSVIDLLWQTKIDRIVSI